MGICGQLDGWSGRSGSHVLYRKELRCRFIQRGGYLTLIGKRKRNIRRANRSAIIYQRRLFLIGRNDIVFRDAYIGEIAIILPIVLIFYPNLYCIR